MTAYPPEHNCVLRAGESLCEIWPDAGGSIGRWAVNGQEMLRRAMERRSLPRPAVQMAAFPLVPYSNRIGFGRFEWGGKVQHVTANFAPEPHAIHGTGWTAKWDVAQKNDHAIILHHSHVADEHWPWPFRAQQRIKVSEGSLSIDLTAQNLADQPVPLAFGHHPYFDSEGATLAFRAGQIWKTGADGLPAFAEAPTGQFDFANGSPVAGRVIDNCYAQWDGRAEIGWDGRPMTLEIEADMQAAVVYIPAGGNSFCFEPVPHINNALNLPRHKPQMPIIEPGGVSEAHITFKAIPRNM